MIQRISSEIEKAVEDNHGMVQVEGERSDYVVMTKAMYHEVLGTNDDREAEATLAAIQRGMADVEARRTMPAADFFAEFDRRHGIQD